MINNADNFPASNRQQQHKSPSKRAARAAFLELFLQDNPVPPNEILENLELFISRQQLSRMLFMRELYTKILNVHGVIMEFGVRYGRDLALFANLRGIYEPFNHNRKIIGFDTFEGFTGVDSNDTGCGAFDPVLKKGSYAVPQDYQQYLEKILDYHEMESPISQIKKYELVKGDASETIHMYLQNNPHTIIAMAYFDMDVYRPTRDCMEAIVPHLTKGSVIGLDEVNYSIFPGETIALQEVFHSNKIKLQRYPFSPNTSFFVVE